MAHEPSNALSAMAGKPAPRSILVDLARLERDYYQRKPDLSDPARLVAGRPSQFW